MSSNENLSSIIDHDVKTTFIFDKLPIKGVLVQLSSAWQDNLEAHTYSDELTSILGQTLAGIVALSSSMKYEGYLQFQLAGSGWLSQLSATSTTHHTIRGVALENSDIKAPEGNNLLDMVSPDTRAVISLFQKDLTPYRGIISVERNSMQDILMDYMNISEQIDSILRLAANKKTISALMIQRMPSLEKNHEFTEEDIHTIKVLTHSIKDEELLELKTEEILTRLYHEYDVRVLEQTTFRFECSCSKQMAYNALLTIGQDEALEQLKESNPIEIQCHNCNRTYYVHDNTVHHMFEKNLSKEDVKSIIDEIDVGKV